MKYIITTPTPSFTRKIALFLALAALYLTGLVANAHPFASGISGTNGAGVVSFVLNEGGATVDVVFEDNTTNHMGVLPKGPASFTLGAHTSFRIICFKAGSGTPSLISTDTDTYAIWNSPRGVAANKNPAKGSLFGRLYVGNNAAGAKAVGVYALNADQTFVTGPVSPTGFSWSGALQSNFGGPDRMRVNDDSTVLITDGDQGAANILYQFQPDLSSSIVVLGKSGGGPSGDLFGTPKFVGSIAAGNLVLYTTSTGVGAPSDTNCIKGPLTGSGSFNCVFRYNIGAGPLPWTKRPDYAYTVGLDGIANLRPELDVEPDGKVIAGFGRANASNPNLQILRPLPTTNGITGDAINKAIQDAARDATNWLYTGGVVPPFNIPPNGSAADPWVGLNGSGVAGGTYGGVRVSPDGQYLASVDVNNGVTIANLTNGIPNEGTIFGISQGTFGATTGMNTANARGMDWDAADNLWICSSGQGLLRCYSLGLTTTCVTSNDWTGTNGAFNLLLPPVQASVAVINGTASQNYVNNTVNAGTPTPGVFRISLNTSDTTASGPVTVAFVRGGTAAYTNNFSINTNETPNGVTITPTSVIFPGAAFTGSNGPNWNVDVRITPTKLPLSGPTLTFNVRLVGGTNYSAAAPLNGSIAILNTGPQLIQLSAAAPATLGGMNRGIPNDQARFVITRLGDTNGPNNDAVNPITQRPLTITALNYFPPAAGSNFMAKPGVDFTAQAQKFTGGLPVDGAPGIVINPGEVTVTAMIGNPVKHTDTSIRSTNLTVIINLTNICNTTTTPGCNTNQLSGEGYPYLVNTTGLTLSEFDNALGGETVVWSNPLTNALDSTNWTLVYANINQGGSPTLPIVISNYDNSANINGLSYYAVFGKSINDPGNDGSVTVPPSATMTANGWNTALKVSVNKNPGGASESGVNLYPQIPGAPWNGGSNFMTFGGNYALRFDMFLSLYDFGINNGAIGTPAREFAAFGINHYGTNANWRLDVNPRADGTGARPINSDGEWCTIDAASGSITPADYDMFISPPWAQFSANGNPLPQTVPFTTNLVTFAPFTNAYQFFPGNYSGATNFFANSGVPNDQQSANNNAFGGSTQNGILKSPPFSGINSFGGAPDNAWIDVSLELSRQTNLALLVARQQIFSSPLTNAAFGVQNVLAPFSGTPMLGYLDPNLDISDYSAFVYYSNIRIVELSPFIPWTNQPASLIVTQGSSFTLSSGATFASNPLTNVWYLSNTNGPNLLGRLDNGTPTISIATNTFAATNGLASIAVNNIQTPTNYIAVWSDQAGSITSFVATIEVITGPGDKTGLASSSVNFAVTASGNAPPTAYQWTFFGTNLVNSAKYSGVATASLTINNLTAADAGAYSVLITNAYTTGLATGTLTINSLGVPPYQFTTITNGPTTIGLAFTTANPGDVPGSFTLQSAGLVTGPYTNNPAAITGANPNFLISVPKTAAQLYYRLQHN